MNSLASTKSQSWLSWFLRGVLILIFLILFSKMFEVQIIKGAYYRDLSDQNRIRHIPIPTPRGHILARDGSVLATNIEIKKRIKFNLNGSFEITDDLTGASPDEIVTDYKRVYPLADAAAHAIGYLSVVGDNQVGKINPNCPDKGPVESGSLVGTTGLEQSYQCVLEGVPGEELIEVNTAGKKIRSLGRRDPIPGTDIKTTIDANLQIEVANDMEQTVIPDLKDPVRKGAAIVTDGKGGILAFYSMPSFDPNLLITHDDKNKLSALFNDISLPFFNREISGTFHPGSVFKPMVATAALEEGAINKDYTYTDTGSIEVNGFTYRNWYATEYGRTEGTIGLTKAIARSTDTFFYKTGELTGPNNIAKWADNFGLNKPTGIDIPGETQGLVPTTDWKKQKFNEIWFLGDTYHMSIGQGYVALTPIEVNTYISALAENGSECTPHFIDGKQNCKNLNIQQQNIDLIKEGMQQACIEGGTAYTFFDFSSKYGGTSVACKTGTAEVGTDGTPHAWFTYFAPAQNPEIVSTILIEKGGQGSTVAGPIARKIADYYFQGLKQ